MPPSNPDNQEEAEKRYDEVVSKQHANLNKTHTKKEFTFSITEKRRLMQQQTVQLLANQAFNDIINLSVLPRLGIDPKDAEILYDLSLGKFTIWSKKEAASQSTEPSVASPTEPIDTGGS